MEALIFIDNKFTTAVEGYFDDNKITYIQLPDPAIVGELATGMLATSDGHMKVIASEFTDFIASALELQMFDVNGKNEVLVTTYINPDLVVYIEAFMNNTGQEKYDNKVVVYFEGKISVLADIDFDQIPILFPNLV